MNTSADCEKRICRHKGMMHSIHDRFHKVLPNPRLVIDLKKVCHNASVLRKRCAEKGIQVMGITKGVNAIPEVARAMLSAGLTSLGDSRLQNIVNMRRAGVTAEMTLIRIPMLTEVESVVLNADCSLNSELSVIKLLSNTAEALGKTHGIILMVDSGDLREGVLPEDVTDLVRRILCLKGVDLIGLGTNFDCLSGVLPSYERLSELAALATAVENKFGIKLETISGGNSVTLDLLNEGKLPDRINQLRIGEAILLGQINRFKKLDYLTQTAFSLVAEIVEIKEKPTLSGRLEGRGAFGNRPLLEDPGLRKRAILAIGKQDVYPEQLIAENAALKIIGASSDHLVVDVTDDERAYSVGDEIVFRMFYPGLLSATTSRYVQVKLV